MSALRRLLDNAKFKLVTLSQENKNPDQFTVTQFFLCVYLCLYKILLSGIPITDAVFVP